MWWIGCNIKLRCLICIILERPGGRDLTGALPVLQFWLSPLASLSFHTRMVCHSGTSIPRLSWKLADKKRVLSWSSRGWVVKVVYFYPANFALSPDSLMVLGGHTATFTPVHQQSIISDVYASKPLSWGQSDMHGVRRPHLLVPVFGVSVYEGLRERTE